MQIKNKATLYLDESGKSSLVEKAAEPFLITGVIVDDWEKETTEGFFKYLKLKYQIDPNKPFHAYEIFECQKTKLADETLSSLALDLASYINVIPIDIAILAINKRTFSQTIGASSLEDFKGSKEAKMAKELPYVILSSLLFIWFTSYLQKNDLSGQIFTDARRGGDAQLLKTLYSCKEGGHGFNKKVATVLKECITAICFAEKNYLCGSLELTDLISFVSFNMLKKNYLPGIKIIWKAAKSKISWTQVRNHPQGIETLDEDLIRSFFKLKKNEVHKYLKKN